MAGEGLLPPVIAEIRGNISDLSAKLGQAREQISQTTEQSSSRFGALSNVSRKTWTEIGGAAVAAGAVMIMGSEKLESAHVRLETAVKDTGASFDDFKGRIDGADKRMEGLGFTADQTETALGTLTTVTGDTKTAIDQMGNVADIARYKHLSLGTAADLVGKLFMGQSRAAKQLGIDVDLTALKHATGAEKIALFGQVMDQVHNKIGGQAEAHLHTLGGELDHYKAVVTDFVEHNGKAFGEVLTASGMAIFGVAQIAPVAGAAVSGLGSMFSALIGKLGASDAALASIGTTEAGVVTETEAASVAMSGLGLAISGVAAVGIAGLIVAWKLYEDELNNARKAGDTWFKSFQAGDAAKAASQQLGDLQAEAQRLNDWLKANDYNGIVDKIVSGTSGHDADIAKHKKELDEVKDAIAHLKAQQDALNAASDTGRISLSGYGRELSLTKDQVGQFAGQLDIDLSKGKASFDQLGKKVEDTQGKLSTAFSRLGVDGDAWANTVLTQYGNVLASDDALATSVGKLADAYSGLGAESLNDAQGIAAMGVQGQLTADQIGNIATEAKSLRDGMQSSFDSATSLVQAFGNQTTVTAGQINKSLADMNAQAHKWAADLKAAAQAGIDQGLIAEVAQAGPKALPLLEGLLADVKAGNLSQINQTEADIRTQLGIAQGTVLTYESPFFVAGQTIGGAGSRGVGDGMTGSIAEARSKAIAAAQATNEAQSFFQTAGAAGSKAFTDALSQGLDPSVALEMGRLADLANQMGVTLQQAASFRRYMQGQSLAPPGQQEGTIVPVYSAAGRIVDHPTLSWLGEESKREVVIPLTDPARAMELAQQSGLMSMLSGASGGSVAPMTAAAPVAYTRGWSPSSTVVNVGGITIVQQPGENGASLGARVREELLALARTDPHIKVN